LEVEVSSEILIPSCRSTRCHTL